MNAPVSDGVSHNLKLGIISVILLAVGFGGWAATTELAGAVVATGTVVVEGNVKKVQHLTGGVVGDIRVRDGDRVEAGDLLLRLDDTVTRANLLVITRQLDELAVRSARLRAERDGAENLELPATLASRGSEAEVAGIVGGERALLTSRREGRQGQKDQLKERVVQLGQEINGFNAQQAAKVKEIALIGKELAGQHELYAKNLIPITKYTATQREAAKLNGEQANFLAMTAQARGKVAEIELKIIQLDQDLRTEVIKELRDIQAKEAELSERRIVAEDGLRRIDIRAPMSGIVHQLAVHTLGGVITPSEPIMLIVPETDSLVVEARIAPQDIDQVRSAETAFIRFTAFNQRTTPEFVGALSRVAADLTREEKTGRSYYLARITLPEPERLGGLKLIPGMPADVQIKTDDRTVLSYLVKPLTDQVARGFRER